MKHPESDHQIALMQWAAMARTDRVPGVIADYLIAIPNGGSRNPREAARLKAEGVKKGVSDLFLAIPNFDYCHCGLWIELKIKPNTVSKEQKEWIARMRELTYAAEVAWSWTEAKDIILNYLK